MAKHTDTYTHTAADEGEGEGEATSPTGAPTETTERGSKGLADFVSGQPDGDTEPEGYDFSGGDTEYTFDFSNTTEPPKDPVMPKGIYNCQITDVEEQVSDNSGNTYLHVTYKVLDEPFAGVRLDDRRNWVLNPSNAKSAWNLLQRLEHVLGHPIPRARFRLSDYRDEMVGKVVQVNSEPDEYPQGSGEMRNSVGWLVMNRPGAPTGARRGGRDNSPLY